MLEIKNLSKSYGSNKVLNNVNLKFSNTGLIMIVGESGVGKSTLFNIIGALDTNYTGEVIIDETYLNSKNIDELASFRHHSMGFIHQDFNLISNLTVLENILISQEFNEDNIQKVKDLLEKFDLSEKLQAKVENLSGGQKQRVAIARAIIKSPKIVLADEPTGSLDDETTESIMNSLKIISKSLLVVMITHDEDLLEYADTVISLTPEKLEVIKNNDVSQKEVNTNEEVSELIGKEKLLAKSQFRSRFKESLILAISISLSLVAILFSLSFSTVIQNETTKFEQNNPSLKNGFINLKENPTANVKMLEDLTEVSDAYYQYIIDDVSLNLLDNKVLMESKYPTIKNAESLSYGRMPSDDENEIALSPSLAKKFASDISSLIDQTLMVNYQGQAYDVKVSGIYNAGFDDFVISSSLEKAFYKNTGEDKPYSINYDVNELVDVKVVDTILNENSINAKTALIQVEAFIETFNQLHQTFLLISLFIVIFSLSFIFMIFSKFQKSNIKLYGILSSLGYSNQMIIRMTNYQSLYLSVLTSIMTFILVIMAYAVMRALNILFTISIIQIVVVTLLAFIFVLLVNWILSSRLKKSNIIDLLK